MPVPYLHNPPPSYLASKSLMSGRLSDDKSSKEDHYADVPTLNGLAISYELEEAQSRYTADLPGEEIGWDKVRGFGIDFYEQPLTFPASPPEPGLSPPQRHPDVQEGLRSRHRHLLSLRQYPRCLRRDVRRLGERWRGPRRV